MYSMQCYFLMFKKMATRVICMKQPLKWTGLVKASVNDEKYSILLIIYVCEILLLQLYFAIDQDRYHNSQSAYASSIHTLPHNSQSQSSSSPSAPPPSTSKLPSMNFSQ
jgi:hypothetical protein